VDGFRRRGARGRSQVAHLALRARAARSRGRRGRPCARARLFQARGSGGRRAVAVGTRAPAPRLEPPARSPRPGARRARAHRAQRRQPGHARAARAGSAAALAPARSRFAAEQAAIERWLGAIAGAARSDPQCALESPAAAD
jgi:hypothetical protein